MWYLYFSDWLISLSIIIFRSIHAVAKDNMFFSFLFLLNSPVIFHSINVPQPFVHSPKDKHLGCFQTMTVVNDDAMETGLHIVFHISVSGFFSYIARSGITES